ncbi:MAG: hypothetical protein ACXIVE_17540, partial [Salinarimonas sp.]
MEGRIIQAIRESETPDAATRAQDTAEPGSIDPRSFPAGPFPRDPYAEEIDTARPAGPVGPLPPHFKAGSAQESAPQRAGALERLARRFSLRLRVFAMFAFVAAGALAALAIALGFGYARLPTGLQADTDLRAGFMQVAILGGFLILGLVAWIWWLFDQHVAGAVEKLAASLRVSADAGAPGSTPPDTARYLGDLAPAISDAARHLGECRIALSDAVATATQQLNREKAWLETLLADVPAAVLVCSADHDIVFYNAPAAEILGTGIAPGLARPIGDFLADEPIHRAHARLAAARGPEAHADLICTSHDGALVFEGRMRLIGTEGDAENGNGAARSGYVLSLSDVTASHAAASLREARIAQALPRLHQARRALRDRDGDALRAADEAARTLGQLTHLLADAPALPELRSADLADALRVRLAAQDVALTVAGPDLFLRIDGYGFLAMLTHLF